MARQGSGGFGRSRDLQGRHPAVGSRGRRSQQGAAGKVELVSTRAVEVMAAVPPMVGIYRSAFLSFDLWRGVPGIGVDLDKPVIGAVAGWVIGGGLVLANQCALLVAADNATFLYPEAKVGFSGGLISSLAVRIPHKVAMEVLLSWKPVTAMKVPGPALPAWTTRMPT